MYLEISLVLLSAAVFLIAAVTVPLMLQLYKFIRGLVATQEVVQKSLPGILENLNETIVYIKDASVTVQQQVEGFSLVLTKVQSALGLVSELEDILRMTMRLPVFNAIRTVGAVAKGLRTFIDVYATGRK